MSLKITNNSTKNQTVNIDGIERIINKNEHVIINNNLDSDAVISLLLKGFSIAILKDAETTSDNKTSNVNIETKKRRGRPKNTQNK